jgi:hypothetical protein
MGKSYSINIEINDVSFVDIKEAQIENMLNKSEENIKETFDTKITSGVGKIQIVFNGK